MDRIYKPIVQQHLADYRQMIFLSGPRQVGKTTLSQACIENGHPYIYLNWDNASHRELILAGIEAIAQELNSDVLTENEGTPIIIFDEIHKYKDWKKMLKGYFDTIQNEYKIIVTGSAKLNIYRRGGDSLMGRYFLYRIHPFTVTEILDGKQAHQEISPPKKLDQQQWDNLLQYGGFPEPFLQADDSFYQRWQNLRKEQLIREDLRDVSQVHDLARVELLATLLIRQITGTTKYSELAKKVQVSEPTIRDWIDILSNVYYCFAIRPWSKNVARAILKEPKIYLWDWSLIDDPGAKIENLVACHLHKAVHFWTDIGLGKYSLHYLRTKDKQEVDFLVTKNEKPWLMVEVKSSSSDRISPALKQFSEQLKPEHAFQVVANMPYVDKDCFKADKPMIVPLLTFLSQLV